MGHLQGDRPRVLSRLHEEELLAYSDERPMAYLNERAYYLFDEFDIAVDEATVWRTLNRLGWSRKTLHRTAAQRNQDLRNHWMVKLSRWRGDQLIFLDDSAACERTGTYMRALILMSLTATGDRKYGWSPYSIRPTISQILKRSKR